MHESSPLVSVVTPVFNGSKYLRQCIESVVGQTYENWDYTIVDNCSTDDSLGIALAYADKDSRIKVIRNGSFVGAIENHNIAFRAISSSSEYCKLVSADDWLFPECILKMVDLAELHPSVGIIGSYCLNAKGIPWGGLPLHETVFKGRELSRKFLLGLVDSFWLPTTVLYRSSLVRSRPAFFPGSAPSADLEACLNCLLESDLGFVHQILSFERIHTESISAKVAELDSYVLDRLRILKGMGPLLLERSEYNHRLERLLAEYYSKVLVPACLWFRETEFWDYHKKKLMELGYSIYDPRLAKALIGKIMDLLLNPKTTVEKLLRRIGSKGTDRSQKAAKALLP